MTSTGVHSIALRPHQQAAYDAATSADRGIIKMFCGTGKTRIMLRLITDNTHAISIIVFPRIALVEQFKKDYLENADFQSAMSSIASLCICSDDNATTNKQEIRSFIESDASRKLFCITYQSLEILIGILESSDLIPDLVLFDEAHHVVSPVTYNVLLTSCIAEANQILYFTATPTEEMDEDEDEIFGPVLFSYTHREAVKDEICNKFEILIRFAEGDLDKNLYDHTAAAYKLIPNGRILAFHSFAEAEREGRTSVVQFRGAAAKKRCNEAFGRSVRLEAVTAKTKDKNAILQEFEATADDDIFMLHNCNILGEGIDTKTANAVLFADPKSSVVQIVQNVGRITRKPAGVKRPASVIIPISVDMSRFKDMDAEARHAAICEEITKGRFQTIQTVLGALHQEDEEIMDIILKSPDRYTPKEVEQTFKAAGYAVTEEAATLGALCGVDVTTEEEVAAAIGRPIKIHGQSMETPIRTIGDGTNPLKVMHNEDAGTWTKMEREDGEAEVKAPRRPFKIKFAVSEEFGIKWDAKDFIDAVGSAIIDCTISVNNWEERRQEWIAMYEKLGKPPTRTSKNPEEKKAGTWQSTQRKGYNNKPAWMTQERIAILDATPGWLWEKVDDWEERRQEWIAMYEKLGKRPSKKSKDPEEKKAGSWQGTQRACYKLTQMTQERIIILNATPGWLWEVDNWEECRQKWIALYEKLGRCPSDNSKDPEEKKTYRWQSYQRECYKLTRMTQERVNILTTTPGWLWKKVDDWEERRQEWIAMYEKLGKCPSSISKNSEEKKAGSWQSHQRVDYNNKVEQMTPEKIALLNTTPGWLWEKVDDWEERRQGWISMYEKLGKRPSKRSNDPEEKKAGSWQANQRVYHNSKAARLTPERIAILSATPGWLWSGSDSASTISEEVTQDIIEHVQDPIRVHKKPTLGTGVQTGIKHTPSALEVYHQRFKTMNSSTYAKAVTSEEWAAYHKEADKHDARDPESRKPINRLATLCAKYLRPNCRVADLGCGRNQLRTLAPQFRWTSVDVHAADQTVHVTDIGSMPSDWDGEFNAAILGRSLWARDHMTQLREAFRVLADGGILIVCESVNRWPNNTLIEALEEAGFHIKNVEETSSEDPFQYIVAQRPLC
jgi:superfamily II DNA or RNA helicase